MTDQEYSEVLQEIKEGKKLDTNIYKVVEPNLTEVLEVVDVEIGQTADNG